MTFNVTEHVLVPEYKKLTPEEKEKVLEEYNISVKELPKILKADPSVAHLDVDAGDVIEISRKSPTAGEAKYYRVVIRG